METRPTAEHHAYYTCPLCEATCGLDVTLRGQEILHIRGDKDDVFSRGFICPKGATLKPLHEDPDRLRRPMIRRGDTWHEASWDEAFAEVERGLMPILEAYGRDAVALYFGNPNVHNLAGALYARPLAKTLGSKNVFSASTVDQMPKHVSSGLLFGHPDLIPVPDLDRTDYLLMLGANPMHSNGSLCTAPDFPGRLKALRRRGGTLVVIDPRRSWTAQRADEHLFIRPGTDVYLLFGIIHTLFAENRTAPGPLAEHTTGLAEVEAWAAPFSPEAVAAITGVAAATIRRLARALAAAPTAVVYGRIGTHTVPFGTLSAWAVDAINLLTGNLDRAGGAMFAHAAHSRTHAGKARGFRTGRWHSRVRRLPEVRGELPVATLADEIETPGTGQVRALITVAGNPVLSTPQSARLDAALAALDFMVSVDPYLNETTRHAHVILPPPPPLARSHYDYAFYRLSVRNVANYSPPLLDHDGIPEYDILARLALIVGGMGAGADPALVHRQMLAQAAQHAVSAPGSSVAGRNADALIDQLEDRRPTDRLIDFLLRAGPYGDGFGMNPDGLSLARLEAHPHGIDLGPLTPRLPAALRTASGTIELAAAPLAAEVARLKAALAAYQREADVRPFVLVGRRHLRSNNSWMHNIEALVKGKARCTLQVHPDDAAALGLADGDLAEVTSRVGRVEAPVEVTADIMPGVVSLPHGWGHRQPGTRLAVAARHAGVNANVLTDADALDPLSGNAVLNAVPVVVKAMVPDPV